MCVEKFLDFLLCPVDGFVFHHISEQKRNLGDGKVSNYGSSPCDPLFHARVVLRSMKPKPSTFEHREAARSETLACQELCQFVMFIIFPVTHSDWSQVERQFNSSWNMIAFRAMLNFTMLQAA